ncbi:MAG: DUF4262 domain-containing protein [Vicinamibacterales bacterium]
MLAARSRDRAAFGEGDVSVSMKQVVDDLARKMRKHGHAVVSVFADPDRFAPEFSYTVGLSKTGGLPELLIFGIDPRSAQRILNDLASHLKSGGRPKDGVEIEKIANMPLMLKGISAEVAVDYARMVEVLLGAAALDVMQVVWPDPKRRFPDDPLYDHLFDLSQPRLWDRPRSASSSTH